MNIYQVLLEIKKTKKNKPHQIITKYCTNEMKKKKKKNIPIDGVPGWLSH